VGIGKRVHYVTQVPDSLRDRQLPFAGQLGAERLALDEGHGVVQQVAGPTGSEQGDDVRMLELGGELDLTAEALDVDRSGKLGWQHLDHHLPSERDFLREIHPAHPTTAELSLQAVGAAERVLELP
jgi:hypothetical protein